MGGRCCWEIECQMRQLQLDKMASNFPTKYTYLKLKTGGYFGIVVNDKNVVVVSVDKQNAIRWKTSESGDQISLYFQINGIKQYLAYDSKTKKAGIQRKQSLFGYSIFDQFVMFNVNHFLALSYYVEQATSMTTISAKPPPHPHAHPKKHKDPDYTKRLEKLLIDTAVGMVSFVISAIAMPLIKKLILRLVNAIKSMISQEAGEAAEESLGSLVDNSDTEEIGDPESAQGADGLDAAGEDAVSILEDVGESLL